LQLQNKSLQRKCNEKEDGTVLNCFMGSGSTGVACKETGPLNGIMYYARFMRAFFICHEKIARLNRFTAFLFSSAYDLSQKAENAPKGV